MILPPRQLDRQIESEHQENGPPKLTFLGSRFQSSGFQDSRVQASDDQVQASDDQIQDSGYQDPGLRIPGPGSLGLGQSGPGHARHGQSGPGHARHGQSWCTLA